MSSLDQSSPFVSSASDKPIPVSIPGGAAAGNETAIIPCFVSREDLNVTLRTVRDIQNFITLGHFP